MNRAVLTVESLLAWARTKKPTETIGVSSDEELCPIANYLNAVVPLDWKGHWTVGSIEAYPVLEGGGWIEDAMRLPGILQDVVFTVDSVDLPEDISAGEFIRIVLGVCRVREAFDAGRIAHTDYMDALERVRKHDEKA